MVLLFVLFLCGILAQYGRTLMIIRKNDLPSVIENESMGGEGVLHLDVMTSALPSGYAVTTFAKASLEPNSSVGFHVHEDNCEAYYIISGEGEYSDDGEIFTVTEGDLTFTPEGHGHGIKNCGDAALDFIALIIKKI